MKGMHVSKILNDRLVIVVALFLSISALMSIAAQFSISRFWLYDKQNRALNPDHYSAELVTKADFDQIADPSIRTIALSNGSQFTKADRPEWEEKVIPFYKPIGTNDYYLKVTTKGTAHVVPYCFESVVLAFVQILMIVALCTYHLIKSGKGQPVAPEHAAARRL